MEFPKAINNKKYLLFFPVICLLGLFCLFNRATPDKTNLSPTEKTAVPEKTLVKEPAKTTAVAKAKLLQQLPLRNPFLPPQQPIVKSNNNPNSISSVHLPAALLPSRPMLRGIIKNEARLWALIETGGKTTLCTSGEYVGVYKVLTISVSEVVLKSPNEQLNLKL